MPCNIGYREVAKVVVPTPLPEEFKEEIKPPEVNQDLLDKIGVDDEEFLEWLSELDVKPLLELALEQALKNTQNSNLIQATIDRAGRLIIKAKFTTRDQRRQLEKISANLRKQFQMQILAIVAQLLNYRIIVQSKLVDDGEMSLILEGEKNDSCGVNKYLKITLLGNGEGLIQFEHFSSEQELASEQQKFLGLVQKLGSTLRKTKIVESGGQPIPTGTRHQHFLREQQ